MRFLIQLIVILLLTYLLGSHIPYWTLMLLIAGITALLKGPPFLAFVAGGIGVGLIWLLVPLMVWSTSGSELPDKMAEIMGLGNSALLIGITGLIGFLVGASSALAGNLLGKLFENNAPY